MSTKSKEMLKRFLRGTFESDRINLEAVAETEKDARDIQSLDMLDDDLLARMGQASSFSEWWDLHERREALRVERDALTMKAMNGSFSKAKRLNKTEIQEVNETIIRMQKHGAHSTNIISELQKKYPKLSERYKAERAYWTAVKSDDTQKVGLAAEALDFDKYRVILSPNACQVCIKKTNDGRKIFKNADIEKSGYGHVPPFHPNAVLGDTPVILPGLQKLIRAPYSGEVIKITFSDGRFLSITKNHVLLTRRGFVSAHLLRKGDDVINSSVSERIFKQDPDNNDGIATIEQLFDAAVEASGGTTTSMPAASEDLHGDARFSNGNIDIVDAYSLLEGIREPMFLKHLAEILLGNIRNSLALNSQGNFDAVLTALALASDGIMSGTRIADIVGLSSGTMVELQGLLDPANYDTRIKKALTNDGSADFKPICDAVLGLSSFIEFDNIVDIECVQFHGYVYDASTTSQLYIINNTVSSNCYCIIIPID